jgi:hypothetical protein
VCVEPLWVLFKGGVEGEPTVPLFEELKKIDFYLYD